MTAKPNYAPKSFYRSEESAFAADPVQVRSKILRLDRGREMSPLRVAYESARDRIGISFEEFAEAIKEWEVVPLMVGGEIAGAVLINGPELHACVIPQFFGKWISRRVLRETLKRVADKHGYALTRVKKGNDAGDRFVRRLGFDPVGEQGGSIIYKVNHGT